MSRLIASLVLAQLVACRAAVDRCAQDRASSAWLAARASCEAEFARTQDPARAIDTAMAAYYLQRPLEAIRFAAFALIGPTAAHAHRLIGSAELDLGEFESAQRHLLVAATLDAAAGDAHAEARDRYQLSGVAYKQGNYRDALVAEEAARDAARRDHDDRMTVYANIALADILREVGDRHAAEVAIEQAIAEARAPEDRASALLKRGILYIDQGSPALAREPLTRSLQEELATARRAPILEALHLNLSYVERKARAFLRALDELEQARQAGANTFFYRLNRGLVLADMGQLAGAAADLEAAEAEPGEGEYSWWVPSQRARVAARLGDLPAAIAADRRAIAQVAALASRAGSLGPTMIANHREPHLHLLGLLAAERRWTDVLQVVATMDSQSLLASRELAVDPAPTTSSRSPPRPARPGLVLASDAGQRAVQAWRGQRLVVVVPGGDRVWRLDVHDGEVSGSDVGAASTLAALARTLETDPDNVAAGRALGAAMLVPHLTRHARVALLVIGPMARAPLAGLRVGDRLAIADHDLMRAPGLLPRARATPATLPALVIGDPGGDLPAAANEARDVAARLRGRALIGGAATRAAFAQAAGATTLHIAAHTTQRRDGATLDLADGPVTVDEIARLAPAPRLVVLASCGAAAGRDDAGNGSLASAFLGAGADVVVGTRWSVGDTEAAQLVDAFYAEGGAHDPARALGAAQLRSDLPATVWAAFEVMIARPAR